MGLHVTSIAMQASTCSGAQNGRSCTDPPENPAITTHTAYGRSTITMDTKILKVAVHSVCLQTSIQRGLEQTAICQ